MGFSSQIQTDEHKQAREKIRGLICSNIRIYKSHAIYYPYISRINAYRPLGTSKAFLLVFGL
ncbi:hypothetical protein D3C71_995450 [compost metagenome]